MVNINYKKADEKVLPYAVYEIRDTVEYFAEHAEAIVRDGQADLVAIAREAMNNPNWALHAEQRLRGDLVFEQWPPQAGWWLANRARTLEKLKG